MKILRYLPFWFIYALGTTQSLLLLLLNNKQIFKGVNCHRITPYWIYLSLGTTITYYSIDPPYVYELNFGITFTDSKCLTNLIQFQLKQILVPKMVTKKNQVIWTTINFQIKLSYLRPYVLYCFPYIIEKNNSETKHL